MAQLHRMLTSKQGRARRVALGLSASALLVACGETADPRTSAIDSALSRDLTLAASATPNVAIGDTAVSSAPSAPLPLPDAPRPSPRPTVAAPTRAPAAPRTPRPAPAPTPAPAEVAPAPTPTPVPVAEAPAPAPAPRGRSIGAGVELSGATNAAICSLANRPGDRFVVSLDREVTSPDGALLTAGTPVLVELARVDSTTGEMSFRLRGVQVNGEFYPAQGTVRVVDGAVTERKVSKGGSDQGKVITGAIIGGILGRVLGGGTKGAVIGAAGGAAAGTVAAARNNTIERCLSAGATLSTTLSSPLVLSPSSQ